MAGYPYRNDPSKLVTPGGVIPYWTKSHGFSEDYTAKQGGSSSMPLFIDGIDAGDFIHYAHQFTRFRPSSMGTSPGTPGNLSRNLPLLQPYTDEQYLYRLTANEFGPNSPDSISDNWPFWDWIGYQAQFQTRSYDLVPDDQLSDSPDGGAYRDETVRYVTRTQKMNARERQVKAWQLQLDDGTLVPEGAWLIDQSADWVYTWHEIPVENYPRQAIQECSGKINDDLFDVSSPKSQFFPSGTLLFRGMANELVPYRGPDGRLYFDLSYMFSYRAIVYQGNYFGWNFYPKNDATLGVVPVPWRYRPPSTRRPYFEANLQTLFAPVASS